MSLATEVAGKLNYLNDKDKATVNALAPYSGYLSVQKKLDTFVFKEDAGFTYKMADKNRFLKFGDTVVDTYSHASYDVTAGGVVADFTNTTPDVTEIITDGSNTTSLAVAKGDYVLDGYVSTATQIAETSVTVSVEDGTKFSNGELVLVSPAIDESYSDTIVSISINELTFGTSRTKTAEDYKVKRVSDVFRAKQDAPVGTALTDAAYFEDRTQIGVTNQSLAYHSYNTLTNSYEGLKTEVLFSDVSKDDLLDNSTWMARNGFSKVSDFLYSRGSELVLISNIVQI